MRLVPPLALVFAALLPAQDDQPPTLPSLVKDLRSAKRPTWKAAELELVRAGSDAVPLLIPHLSGEREDLRYMRVRVLNVLGRMGADAKAAKPALEKLMGRPDKHLGNLAATSLVQIDPKHNSAVKRLVKCRNPLSKMVGCGALVAGGPGAVPHLLEMARDRHKGVRDAAGRALATIVADRDAEFAGPVLLSMLEIDGYVVRCAALAALADMSNPPKSTADKVRPLLASSKTVVRVAAIQCLCELKPQPAWLLPALVARLQDPKQTVRRAAQVGLLLNSAGAVKRLFSAKDWQQRRTAAETLRWVEVEDETSRAIPLLVRLLQDPQADVRRAAAKSLGGLAPHSRLAMTELNDDFAVLGHSHIRQQFLMGDELDG